jgi:hypothetical protein
MTMLTGCKHPHFSKIPSMDYNFYRVMRVARHERL